MGTRADFYVGRGKDAEWLGSVAYDGHPFPENIGEPVLTAHTEAQFREAVADRIAKRDDGTTPDMGWPWPWVDSRTTDYAYAFEHGYTWCSSFGHSWFRPAFEEEPEEAKQDAEFPDMTARQNVTWGRRSGVMVIQFPAPGR